eukprot:TRINITY_DN29135_c0_g1_i1.p1 TRINITY_DN29135_c0_g1~~TRINITY_DN29135_c0_g1_i1.p1  ORF type:complete len:641 (+),score=130.89 TRINITY_DN29135_c0_g1_i1:93-1925(+)
MPRKSKQPQQPPQPAPEQALQPRARRSRRQGPSSPANSGSDAAPPPRPPAGPRGGGARLWERDAELPPPPAAAAGDWLVVSPGSSSRAEARLLGGGGAELASVQWLSHCALCIAGAAPEPGRSRRGRASVLVAAVVAAPRGGALQLRQAAASVQPAAPAPLAQSPVLPWHQWQGARGHFRWLCTHKGGVWSLWQAAIGGPSARGGAGNSRPSAERRRAARRHTADEAADCKLAQLCMETTAADAPEFRGIGTARSQSACALSPSGNTAVVAGGDRLMVYAVARRDQLPSDGQANRADGRGDAGWEHMGTAHLASLAGHSGGVRSVSVAIPPLECAREYAQNTHATAARRPCPLLVASVGGDECLRLWRIFDAQLGPGFGSRRNKVIEQQARQGALVASFERGDDDEDELEWRCCAFHPSGRTVYVAMARDGGPSYVRWFRLRIGPGGASGDATDDEGPAGRPAREPGQLRVRPAGDRLVDRRSGVTCMSVSDDGALLAAGDDRGGVTVFGTQRLRVQYRCPSFLACRVRSVALSCARRDMAAAAHWRHGSPWSGWTRAASSATYVAAVGGDAVRVERLPLGWKRLRNGILALLVVVALMRLFELRILRWS